MAFGKGLISMTKAVVKGGFVDLPLAFAKGLHHTPRFYGHKLREHGKVGGLGERLDRVYQGRGRRSVDGKICSSGPRPTAAQRQRNGTPRGGGGGKALQAP
ncbi:hypothetical protein CTA1_2979 [Colletotrichum tanaceti]|uniref:Uncharacterized protein n=1 Tax=Colletotrichum tanaceti TaxID=1306861 RepID=A0A4U6XJN8_9PEZI|nr:hypothetical protein CTA1_2979 [Colletotrichum tanaceti]